MDTTTVRNWAEIIGLLIGAGTVIATLWKYVVQPLWRWGKGLSDVHTKVQRIWEELQPNGGGSIRDQINRLTEVAGRIETRQLVSEQVDKQVFAALSIGVFWTDEHGRLNDVNLNYCRLTGRTPSEVDGANWVNFLHADDRDDVYTEWKLCIEEGRAFDRSYRFVRPDGFVQRVQCRACALLNRDNKVIGWFGTIEKQGEAERPKET